MKTRGLTLAVLIGLAPWGWAQSSEMKPSEQKVKETLQETVQKQLDAFRAEDYQTAYCYADEATRAQFPVEAFEAMVKASYPTLAKSTSASFGLAFDNGEVAVVLVRVVGQNKLVEDYHYVLKRKGTQWQVAGLFKIKPAGIQV